jgi:hypothetical protein
MPLNLSDFSLPSGMDEKCEQPKLDDILKTVLGSIAFCVYDVNKVNEIFFRVQQDLQQKYNILLAADITWNSPTIVCEISTTR